MKRLIFGLGSGRSGTVSLSTLLNKQKKSNFTHEIKPVIPWEFSKSKIDSRLKDLMSREGMYLGDVAFYYLPYVNYILKVNPETKFICLKRDKNKVVKSFLKKTKRRNHWVNHHGLFWRIDSKWDKCFPKYKTLFKRQAIQKYWEDYYQQAGELEKKYPDNFLLTDMEYSLNSSKGIIEMMKFLEIKNDHLLIEENIKKNISKN